jgi:hypothetical protein
MSDEELRLTFQALRPAAAAVFLDLLRVIMPHQQPELAGPLNATALVLDSKMVTDLALRSTVIEGIGALDAAGSRTYRRPFSLLTEAEKVAVVKQQEDSMFFQTVLQLAKYDFYNRHIVWSTLGYPDLGNESGYIDKGFDRLES